MEKTGSRPNRVYKDLLFVDYFFAGREQGAYQTRLETARSFLAYGDSPEKVAICTGLPLDVVRGLV